MNGFKELQPKFIRFVEILKNDYPLGVHQTVNVGWQSPPFGGEPLFEPLCECVANLTKLAIIDSNLSQPNEICVEAMWANYNEKHTIANVEHTHHGVFAGVCYVLAPKDSGELLIKNNGLNPIWEGMRFLDRNKVENGYTKSYHSINPIEGMVYLWQSHMPHIVVPNKANQITRLSISFTVTLK